MNRISDIELAQQLESLLSVFGLVVVLAFITVILAEFSQCGKARAYLIMGMVNVVLLVCFGLLKTPLLTRLLAYVGVLIPTGISCSVFFWFLRREFRGVVQQIRTHDHADAIYEDFNLMLSDIRREAESRRRSGKGYRIFSSAQLLQGFVALIWGAISRSFIRVRGFLRL